MWEIKQLLERLGQELAVLLSVVAWVILRVSGVLIKKVSEGKNLKVELFGKEIIEIQQENKCNHTQQEKEKIQVIDELGSRKTINLI